MGVMRIGHANWCADGHGCCAQALRKRAGMKVTRDAAVNVQMLGRVDQVFPILTQSDCAGSSTMGYKVQNDADLDSLQARIEVSVKTSMPPGRQ